MFGRKKTPPKIDSDKYRLVLRCSICTGEQVLCMKDNKDGSLHELLIIHSFDELKKVCEINGINPETVKKIY